MESIIREIKESDIKKILTIYSYYVNKTTISFEETPPSIEEFKDRLEHFKEEYPVLVIEKNNEIMGYAYAHAFRDFSAYDKVAEVTVYLKHDEKSKGFATLLYQELERLLIAKGIIKTIACITGGNDNSLNFHKKCGYTFVAEFKQIGYKFNQWQDIIWLEKKL